MIERNLASNCVAIFISTILFGAIHQSASCQDSWPEDRAVYGKILDEKNKPVENVTVYLAFRKYSDDVTGPQITAAITVSKSDGTFVFSKKQQHEFGKKRGVAGVLAIASDGRLGFNRYFPDESGKTRVDVTLSEVKTCRARLVDTKGQPIVGARLECTSVTNDTVQESYSSKTRTALFPSRIRERFAATTDEKGWISIKHLPVTGAIGMKLKIGSGYGDARILMDLVHPVTIQLAKAGSISGRLTNNGKPISTPSKCKLTINSYGGTLKRDHRINLYKAVKLNEDGTFHISSLVPQKYSLALQFDSESEYCEFKKADVVVESGKAHTGIEIEAIKGLRLEGSFVDENSGKPISGIHLRFSCLQRRGQTGPFRYVETDDDGKFKTWMPKGEVYIALAKVPEKWLAWPSRQIANKLSRVKLDTDKTLPPFKLKAATELKIQVLDENEKPVVNALVHVMKEERHGAPFQTPWLPTDKNGMLTLKQLDPNGQVTIRAYKGERCSAGAVKVDVANHLESTAPYKIEIDGANAFRFQGKVVDSHGKVIPNARLSVEWYRDIFDESGRLSGARGSRVKIGLSDRDGSFKTRPLFAGDRYRMLVEADGYSKYESKQVRGKLDEIVRLGEIKLFNTTAKIQGKLTITGNPDRFKRARVFSFGEDGNRVDAKMDGVNFSFEKLPDRDTWILVDADGFRFTGKFTPVNIHDLRIRIVPTESKLKIGVTDPSSFRERCELSREIIKAFRKAAAKMENGPKLTAVDRYEARTLPILEPDRKKTVMFFNRPRGDLLTMDAVRIAVLELEWKESTIKLIDELLARTRPGYAQSECRRLAHFFETRNPEIAKHFANQMVIHASPTNPLNRIFNILDGGNMLIRLGEKELGEKVVNNALGEFDNLDPNKVKPNAESRAQFAARIAPLHRDRAIEMIEALPNENLKKQSYEALVENLAWKDADAALEFVKKLEDRSTRLNNAKLKIAYYFGMKDAKKGEAIVESINSAHGAKKIQADAMGWLAVACNPNDPQRAQKLISRRAETYFRNPSDFRSWTNYGGRSCMAAHNVIQAKAINHPYLHSVVMQTLACMPTRNEYWNQQSLIEAKVKMAFLLAGVDPVNTRRLLKTVDSDLQRMGGIQLSDSVKRMKTRAFAFADPEAARDYALAEIQKLTNQRGKEAKVDEITLILDALTTHPTDWPSRDGLIHFSGWFPGR